MKDRTCGSLLTHYHDLQVYGTKVELRFACEEKAGIMCKILKRHYYFCVIRMNNATNLVKPGIHSVHLFTSSCII